MAAFTKTAHTDSGRRLMAKGVAGKHIQFTRIVLGDGYLAEGQKPREMEGLVHEVLSLPVPKNGVKDLKNGEVVVWAPFTNAAMDIGFYYREAAALAIDPDTGDEVSYCYGNAEDEAEWIPATGGPTIIEKLIRLVTVIGEATHVTGNLNSEIVLTAESLEDHNNDPEAHHANNANQHIATITHNLGILPAAALYAGDYGYGVGGYGEGPYGGTELTGVPVKPAAVDRNTIKVYAPERYAGYSEVSRLSAYEFALSRPDSATTLTLILR